MAHTEEYTIDGVKMRITFEILEVDRNKVEEQLKSAGLAITDENVNKLTAAIKSVEEMDFEEILEREVIRGDDGMMSFTIYDHGLEICEELEEEELEED